VCEDSGCYTGHVKKVWADGVSAEAPIELEVIRGFINTIMVTTEWN